MTPKETAKLTTHVLDTSLGRPAANLSLALWRVEGEQRAKVVDAVTNADGRCDSPLLAGESFLPGVYELVFAAGTYFDRLGLFLPQPKFLDEVVIRFGLAEPTHYHVPLLLSPFGYSTYRGS
ncbi:hydroxyisourate hydrolase [Consotaella salsifontis]|uniref:5-hydroxyisourate hydrolase n=1 Tax=Consotaella salsifontis TaxID=1365950 RepID=A0A1T4SQY5_9HYPH|nr:hydroxyisourate hydrolase [Consotaella salsifontis]SKA30645.1 5-hydroxyisourate hydrolase [Consotaella salsifontis]